MARFWRRHEDKAIEQILRANRPEPDDGFASSILQSIGSTPAPAAPRQVRSGRRFALALAITVVALSIAGVLGGISAASTGVHGIVNVATKAVSSSHTSTTGVNSSTSIKNDDNKGDKDDKGKKCDGDNDGDDKGCKGDDDDDGDHDGDHHQYKVGVCHWVHRTHNHAGHYVLIFVSQQGAANHFAHHLKDKKPVNGHC